MAEPRIPVILDLYPWRALRAPDVPQENRFAAERRHERLALTRPTAPRRPPSLQPPKRGRTPKLVSIVDRATCPSVATDRYNRIVAWNTSFGELVSGYRDLVGANLQDLLRCRQPNGNLLSHSHVALHEMVLSGEAPAAFEIDIEPEGRPKIRAEVSIVVVLDTDPENHWLVYLLRPRLRRRRLDAALARILDPASSAPRRNTPDAKPLNLTRRQLQVLEIMATGATATEIASELNIKVNTVRTHIRAIFEALGVSRQTEAVARAVRDHLI